MLTTCHLINCNIGGVPLKWNQYGSFDNVPVLPKEIPEPDYKVDYYEIGRYLDPEISKVEMEQYLLEYDYIYFVFYCKCLGSFTRTYLNLIKDYRDQHAGSKVKYIYVVTDPLLHHLEKS